LGSTLQKDPEAGPPFKGGWIGYLSYDVGRLFEQLPFTATDDLTFPLFEFTYHPSAVAYDPKDRLITGPSTATRLPNLDIRSTFSRTQYEDVVRRCLAYISAGDIFQVNLSQRFSTQLTQEAAAVYASLLGTTPAVFGAYLDYSSHALVCNSPE